MVEIRYSKEFYKNFLKLKKKDDYESNYILGLILKANEKLSKDKEAGKKIQKKLWPKEYKNKFGITNLWKYNLDSYWRLMYSITSNEIEIYLIYLEYLGHKKYEKRFKYC